MLLDPAVVNAMEIDPVPAEATEPAPLDPMPAMRDSFESFSGIDTRPRQSVISEEHLKVVHKLFKGDASHMAGFSGAYAYIKKQLDAINAGPIGYDTLFLIVYFTKPRVAAAPVPVPVATVAPPATLNGPPLAPVKKKRGGWTDEARAKAAKTRAANKLKREEAVVA